MSPPARTRDESATLLNRSAICRAQMSTVSRLSAGSASSPAPVALAALRWPHPDCLGSATTVIVTLPPAGIVPSEQLIGITLAHEPAVDFANTTVTGALSVSATRTSGAAAGPLLATTTV